MLRRIVWSSGLAVGGWRLTPCRGATRFAGHRVWRVSIWCSLSLGQSVSMKVELHSFSTVQTGVTITGTFVVSAAGLLEVGEVETALTADVDLCPPERGDL